VRGYDADGILTPWHTNFWGLFARHEAFGARPPFDLPANWIAKRPDLAVGTPLNLVSTIDITGAVRDRPW
jgi:hypothetical protein